jgi:hypothetical protein
MFEQKTVTQLHPRLSRPMSLSVGHIDLNTLALVFHYQELQEKDGKWRPVQREKELVRGEHYVIDRRRGIVKLVDHPFWHTEGYWAVAPYKRKGKLIDVKEPLLYKGQVKHDRGQYVEATYEHYRPEEVVLREQPAVRELGAEVRAMAVRRATGEVEEIDINAVDLEARERLGYDLPRYAEAADPTRAELGKQEAGFDWE